MSPAERAMAVVSMDRMRLHSRPNRRPLVPRLVQAWNLGIHWASVLHLARTWGTAV